MRALGTARQPAGRRRRNIQTRPPDATTTAPTTHPRVPERSEAARLALPRFWASPVAPGAALGAAHGWSPQGPPVPLDAALGGAHGLSPHGPWPGEAVSGGA